MCRGRSHVEIPRDNIENQDIFSPNFYVSKFIFGLKTQTDS